MVRNLQRGSERTYGEFNSSNAFRVPSFLPTILYIRLSDIAFRRRSYLSTRAFFMHPSLCRIDTVVVRVYTVFR